MTAVNPAIANSLWSLNFFLTAKKTARQINIKPAIPANSKISNNI